MTAEMGCEQVRELAPELALGIAEGEERDAALRHLTGCSGCRQLVSELSSVGDELLQLAPAHDPPAGFQSRILAGASSRSPAAGNGWPLRPPLWSSRPPSVPGRCCWPRPAIVGSPPATRRS